MPSLPNHSAGVTSTSEPNFRRSTTTTTATSPAAIEKNGLRGARNHKVLCPWCSAQRKNKRDPCLSAVFDRRLSHADVRVLAALGAGQGQQREEPKFNDGVY